MNPVYESRLRKRYIISIDTIDRQYRSLCAYDKSIDSILFSL
jgi:hypothetical protein